jgi:sugar/nucleoside kinase (ribokinase family)
MNGLFVGLTTLDFLYLVDHFPDRNQKIVALDSAIAAGGPATNAAITFGYLGNQVKLLSVVGNHALSQVIRQDLANQSIHSIDLEPTWLESPSVSSVIVTQQTGERAVISLNATKFQAKLQQIPPDILTDIDIVLIDGHQMAISEAIASQAQAKNIPVVIDGGSWKAGFEKVLPFIDYAICSANFRPPNCQNQADIFKYLKSYSIPQIAITQGDKPIQYIGQNYLGEITIDPINAVDTLGAGDIFHGAFCHFIVNHFKNTAQPILENNFREALIFSAKIASQSCQSFGTRSWMKKNFQDKLR